MNEFAKAEIKSTRGHIYTVTSFIIWHSWGMEVASQSNLPINSTFLCCLMKKVKVRLLKYFSVGLVVSKLDVNFIRSVFNTPPPPPYHKLLANDGNPMPNSCINWLWFSPLSRHLIMSNFWIIVSITFPFMYCSC